MCVCVCVYVHSALGISAAHQTLQLTADYVPLVLSSLPTAQSPLSARQWMQKSRQSLVFSMLLLKFSSQPLSTEGVCSHISSRLRRQWDI